MIEIFCLGLPAIISVYIYKSLTQNKYTNFDLLAIWSGFVLLINLMMLCCASLYSKSKDLLLISAPHSEISVIKFLLLSISLAVAVPTFIYYLKFKTNTIKQCCIQLKTINSSPEWYVLQFTKIFGIVILLSWIYVSLTMGFFGDDEIVFSKVQFGLDFLVTRYNTWSSRLAIESLLVPLSKHCTIFKLFNIIVLCTLPLGFWLLFKNLNYTVWTFVLAVSLYDISEMSSSGWAATLCNYYYAAAACVFAVYLQIKEKLNIPLYIVLVILMIYGCSAEQCAIAMLVISTGIFGNTRNKAAFLSIIIAALSLFLFLNAPGNSVRLERAIQLLPDFVSYTTAYKVYLGYISTLSYYIFQNNCIMLFFIGVIVFCKTNKLSLALSAMLIFLVLQLLGFKEFGGYFGKNYFSDKDFNFSHDAALAFIINTLFVCLTLWGIVKLEISWRQKVTVIILLATAFAIRSVMGFSPTVWLSHLRTFCFTNFILLASTCYIAQSMEVKEKNFVFIMLPCAVLNFVKVFWG